jgi:hypothetical protein
MLIGSRAVNPRRTSCRSAQQRLDAGGAGLARRGWAVGSCGPEPGDSPRHTEIRKGPGRQRWCPGPFVFWRLASIRQRQPVLPRASPQRHGARPRK